MVFCPPNSSWQHEIVQSCCKLVSGSGIKVGPAVFTRPAREDPGLKTRASCEGWSMWMSSRGLGMLDCVAGCAVVELRLRSRCVDKAEMRFLQPFNNERMLLRPSAVSKYAKKLIVTPLTIPQPYVCQLLAGGQMQSGQLYIVSSTCSGWWSYKSDKRHRATKRKGHRPYVSTSWLKYPTKATHAGYRKPRALHLGPTFQQGPHPGVLAAAQGRLQGALGAASQQPPLELTGW